ncbi:hypothetical protein A3D77_04710 [Candidatus Gottesmanbacteria bacterium RIFCSPHIGHO2_02_FULL_39_11]|uniref:ParB-like N-terminal domain-containing protein n=1 Tax=Candidatus Gottesmanbacteria bacterium RIFCSPHIGHO2_02_FULL_39_11 TaxID=1798382 RepID=A0A1F5ZJE2_9BACT|nr:MAG: hypothetical protein A3D77_04710 [Candidatus Gottesmanbacteria bacterium RIFCSPHIGHO2_02_FULL_39_11]
MQTSYTELVHLDIHMLQPNPLQVRTLIKSENLVDLVESIKEHGIIEPLVVAKTPAGFQIIAGERRWRAAKIVGLKTVPVVVKETTTRGMLELAIIENIQREDLNPIERAQGLQRLIDEFTLPTSEIAKRVGKSPAYVSNTIRLLALPDAIKDGLITGELTEGHARAIAGLTDPKLMIEVYKQILTEGGSVRRAEEIVRLIREEKHIHVRAKKEKIESAELDEIAHKLTEAVNKKLKSVARIQQSNVSATITIQLKGSPQETTPLIREISERLSQ